MKVYTMKTRDVAQYYDDLAKDYDQDRFGNSYGLFLHALERPILERLLQSCSESVLEVGCGTGRFLDLADIGVDISPKMLEVAKTKFPTKPLLRAPCDIIPLPDSSQQCIYSFHLLMHLNLSILQRWSKEMHRLLTRDGRWIVDIPTAFRRRFKKESTGWHGNFAPEISVFEQLGWKVVSVHPILYVPIHRIPINSRPTMLRIDQLLGQYAPKRLSSYQIVELAPRS